MYLIFQIAFHEALNLGSHDRLVVSGFLHLWTGNGDHFAGIEFTGSEYPSDDGKIHGVYHPHDIPFVDRVQMVNLYPYITCRVRSGEIIHVHVFQFRENRGGRSPFSQIEIHVFLAQFL